MPSTRFNRRALLASFAATGAPLLFACGGGGGGSSGAGGSSASSSSTSSSPAFPVVAPAVNDALLLDIHRRAFNLFWDRGGNTFGLVPDRTPTASSSSIAGVGFALTANVIGAMNAYVSRADAAARTVTTLLHFHDAPQGPDAAGMIGYHGFFYHFLDTTTGLRDGTTELSSIDTSLFLMGALTAAQYFDGADATETEIRTLAQAIYERVDWTWLLKPDGAIGHGWTPEAGFISYEWTGFNEAMMVYLLAMASPTFAVPASAWDVWTSTYATTWGSYMGQTYLGFPALFVQQFNHAWLDFRGIADAYMRGKGLDYFENSKRATLAQREYARQNPGGFTGYGQDMWGFTACDGPADATVGGRTYKTYAARGMAIDGGFDDGTLAPWAALASLPFTPGETWQAVQTMKARYGADIYGTYGFYDAFNPTYTGTSSTGNITASAGWVGKDWIALDTGPVLAMAENYMTGNLWSLMRGSPVVKLGLQKAGFTATDSRGAWLT